MKWHLIAPLLFSLSLHFSPKPYTSPSLGSNLKKKMICRVLNRWRWTWTPLLLFFLYKSQTHVFFFITGEPKVLLYVLFVQYTIQAVKVKEKVLNWYFVTVVYKIHGCDFFRITWLWFLGPNKNYVQTKKWLAPYLLQLKEIEAKVLTFMWIYDKGWRKDSSMLFNLLNWRTNEICSSLQTCY